MQARTSTFIDSIGTQTGIGSITIVYFGTPKQIRKSLPDVVSEYRIFAYCLTELKAAQIP